MLYQCKKLVFILSVATLSLAPLYAYVYQTPQKAFIVVPIADLLTQPITSYNLAHTAQEAYQKIPISFGEAKKDIAICPRVHQALFNEVVMVHQEEGDEVEIAILNAFYTLPRPSDYTSDFSEKPQTRYWMLKKNIITFEQLKLQNVSTAYVPRPIECNTKNLTWCNRNTIALKMPFYDPVTKKTYSAGTRFVCVPSINRNCFTTFVYNDETHTFNATTIPVHLCATPGIRTHAARIADFVSLLRSWMHTDNGFIPLVWGGCSFGQRCYNDHFNQKSVEQPSGDIYNYWSLPECTTSPHSGFDASGFIVRAAQICGIPYFFKNSTTCAHHLKSIESPAQVREGDIIWVPGGLLVISNIKNNLIISSFGYQYGYGKVLEAPLEDVFEGIHTYDELINAYFNQEPIFTKKADGSISRTIESWKILRLASVWE